jgi:hypothetical protein
MLMPHVIQESGEELCSADVEEKIFMIVHTVDDPLRSHRVYYITVDYSIVQ